MKFLRHTKLPANRQQSDMLPKSDIGEINPLAQYSVYELVQELKTRNTVGFAQTGPYDDMSFRVPGPATVLFIND